jgi:hypothetical protein
MGDDKTSKRNDNVFRPPRNRAIRSLNDLYVLAGLTSQALLEMQKRVTEHDDEDEIEFEAPSANGETTTVTRDSNQLSKLLHLASARGVYEQFLVAGVALTEDYFQNVLRVVLKWFPKKLHVSVDGKQVERSVGLDVVVSSSTVDEILDVVIQKQLFALFYGSPERYFEYVQKILSIEIEKELKDSFAEIKATRDIIVHNSGIANDVYTAKSGKKARARSGERLEMNTAYFKAATQTLKGLVHSVYLKSLDQFGDYRPSKD